jgi:hypothetical protein
VHTGKTHGNFEQTPQEMVRRDAARDYFFCPFSSLFHSFPRQPSQKNSPFKKVSTKTIKQHVCVIYCHSKVFMVQATRLCNLICNLEMLSVSVSESESENDSD